MSENYIVSARKYRPQTFDTVVGQEHITTTLKNAIRNQHLAHAYLFCGPRGVGKTTCARILAKTINCEHPTADMEACGVCPTCVSFTNNTSFNVFELDAASNNSVDDIRSLIDQVRFAPQQGKYKIYIIDEVHMLSAAAFNAFLKTLEEPPPYAIFILATTEKHKILPTILSRCQIFDFKRITTSDTVSHLQSIAVKEHMEAQEAALHIIAQKSEGCMRDALSMLDRIAGFTNGMLTYNSTMEHLNLLDADFYFTLTDHLLSQDVAGALLQLDNSLERGFEGDVILGGLAEHMRNLLLCKDARMAKLLDVPNDHKPMYHEKSGQAQPSFILSSLNVLNDSELQYKNATSKRLHVEMCLIKLCYVMAATNNAQVPTGATTLAQQQLMPAGEKKNTNNVTATTANIVKAEVAATTTNQATANAAVPINAIPVNIIQDSVTPAFIVAEPAKEYNMPVGNNSVPATPQPGNRRISKNILGGLEDAINNAANNQTEKKILTLEMVHEVFSNYVAKLRQENQSVYHAQFSSMQVEMIPPEEVRFIVCDDLVDAYAKEKRDELINYFRQHTGVMVRITTEIRRNEQAPQQQKVLSKSEIYDEMAQKNPYLAQLKDGLNLQLEY
jgi:DNA polymerase-3 subunit gamma/tau